MTSQGEGFNDFVTTALRGSNKIKECYEARKRWIFSLEDDFITDLDMLCWNNVGTPRRYNGF